MSDENPSHPNVGNGVTVRQDGTRATITLNCHSEAMAADITRMWLDQLLAGRLEFVITGEAVGVTDLDTMEEMPLVRPSAGKAN